MHSNNLVYMAQTNATNLKQEHKSSQISLYSSLCLSQISPKATNSWERWDSKASLAVEERFGDWGYVGMLI
jgi:hypothetical protein